MRIVKLRLKTAQEWETYCATGDHGLFVPSTTHLTQGEDIIVEIGSALLPNDVMVRGRVESWRPALPRARVRAGANLSFTDDEQKKIAFVSDVMRGVRGATRKRKFPRLPVRIAAHYRTRSSSELLPISITEIAVGGALLETSEPLPLNDELIIEIASPGATAALAILATVSYRGAGTATGVKFMNRDAHGRRRITELVRRFKDAP
ncbi:MAG: PilZ domain-containing protein [Kofleriaceae bacterium]|nr:PilZ domain-containing protein [Kofleriaceae bacterium]